MTQLPKGDEAPGLFQWPNIYRNGHGTLTTIRFRATRCKTRVFTFHAVLNA